jgi:hypothetical protein
MIGTIAGDRCITKYGLSLGNISVAPYLKEGLIKPIYIKKHE